MPIKNTATKINIYAFDTDNQVGKTGQALTITVRGVGDGVEFTPSAPAIGEVDATNLKGVYSVSLTAGENNYDQVTIGGTCSTADVIIVLFSWANEQIDFNTTQKASINTEVDTALNTAIPALPTTDSINERLKAVDDKVPTNYLMGSSDADNHDTDIDSVLADTNELQGLISSSKLPAQVKGMDASVLTASALATDAVTEITDAIKNITIDGAITLLKAVKLRLAKDIGAVVVDGNTIKYYDQSGVLLLTDPITITGSTRVVV